MSPKSDNSNMDKYTIFLKIAKKLNKSNIPFFVTGSFAMELYGLERLPSDIDIAIRREDFTRTANLLKAKIITKTFKKNETYETIVLGKDHIEIACFDKFKVNGRIISFGLTKERYERCKDFEIEGVSFKVIPLEDLLLLKIIADRKTETKNDLLDVVNISLNFEINWKKIYGKVIRLGMIKRYIILRFKLIGYKTKSFLGLQVIKSSLEK